MREPITTEGEALARMVLLEQRLAAAHDPQAVEQLRQEGKGILAFWRTVQEEVECQRREAERQLEALKEQIEADEAQLARVQADIRAYIERG